MINNGLNEHSPLVSVVILTYNRRDALTLCLDSVEAQTYSNFEVIVADNHSAEDIAAVVAGRGPAFRVIRLEQNGGACAGRNAGIREARGEIVVTLDNDVILSTPFELERVVEAFDEHPEIQVLAFQVCGAKGGEIRSREWCHARDQRKFAETEFETSFFGEGASAFRREVFGAAGMYYEPLFIGCEGHDLALRILDRGFRILYCPRVRVNHLMSPATRTSDRPYRLYTRNYVWIAFKDYPILAGMLFLIPKLVMMSYFAMRARHVKALLAGIWLGFRGLGQVSKARTPVGRRTMLYMRDLERWRPALWTRFRRHREAIRL